jgi:hypothetical protein
MPNIPRYLKIARWLRTRYTVNGFVTTQHGHFMSVCAALDYAAARRYLGI